MIAAIAAIVVLLIGAGVYFATRKPTDTIATTTTAIPSGTDVTTTGPAPLAPNEGLLLLSASPWGDIDKVVNTADNKEVQVEDNLSTPARLKLPPGNYDITLLDQSGRPKTVAVTVEGGKPTRKSSSGSNA